MNSREFQSAFATLSDYYGDNAFTAKAMGVIYKIVEPLTVGEFEQVIEQISEEFNRAPSPGQIRKFAYPLIARANERKHREALSKLEDTGNICQYCGHSGYILAVSRKNLLEEFSFRCPYCPATNMRRQSRSIHIWSDDFKTDYMPVSLKPHSFNAFSEAQRKAWVRPAWKIESEKKQSASEFENVAQKILEGGFE